MKRFQTGMIGVFLGAVLACPMALLLIATNRQLLSGSWSAIFLNTIANGMASGFLTGLLRGPVKGNRIELPQDQTKRLPAVFVFCPQLGFFIGGVLAAGAQIVVVLQTDLVSAFVINPALAWATMFHQGGVDLLGRIIAGAIGGAVVGGLLGGFLPRLNVSDDDTADPFPEFTPLHRKVKEPVDQAELPIDQQTIRKPQANLPIKTLGQVRKPPGNDGNPLQEIIETASAFANAKDYASVVNLLEPARSAHPDVLNVALDLADAYAELGQNAKADEEFRRAIAIDPNLFVVHYNYGCFLRDTGAMDQAIVEFRESVALNPAHVNSWLNLADLATSAQEGIDYLEKARAMGCRDAKFDKWLTMWQQVKDGGIDVAEQRVVWAEQALLKKDLHLLRHELALARHIGLSNELQARAYAVEAEIERQQENFSESNSLLLRAIELNPKLTSYWNTLSAREFLLAEQRIRTNQAGPNEGNRKEVTDLLEQSIKHALAAIEIGNYAMPNQNAARACLYLQRLKESQNYALAAQQLAKKALEQKHECYGCPMLETIEQECRSCLDKANGTLREIELASGDYQVSEGPIDRGKRPSQVWAEASTEISKQIEQAAFLQARALGISALLYEATRLNAPYQLSTKNQDWREFGMIALHLTARYLPDMAYVVTYALRELKPPLKYDPVPFIFTALQNIHYMRMGVITHRYRDFAQVDVLFDSGARVDAAASLIARELSVTSFNYARAILGTLDAKMQRAVITRMERFNPHGLTLLLQSGFTANTELSQG